MASNRQKAYYDAQEKEMAGQMAGQASIGKEPNQVDFLKNQLERSEARVAEQDAELLGLYRRLHQHDRPSY